MLVAAQDSARAPICRVLRGVSNHDGAIIFHAARLYDSHFTAFEIQPPGLALSIRFHRPLSQIFKIAEGIDVVREKSSAEYKSDIDCLRLRREMIRACHRAADSCLHADNMREQYSVLASRPCRHLHYRLPGKALTTILMHLSMAESCGSNDAVNSAPPAIASRNIITAIC